MNQASVGGDIFILLMFVWFIGSLAWAARDILKDWLADRRKLGDAHRHGISVSELRGVGDGVAAIVVWVILYFFLQWVKAVGWVGYLLYAIPIALLLSFLAKRSRAVRDGVPALFDRISYLMEDKAGWIVGFWGLLFVGGILYFFLFAPYGVLCILGLRPCGGG
jgi:hypothetical protein